VNSGEYKLMGLAPFGEPRFVDVIRRELVEARADGSFRLNQRYFDYLRGERMTNARFARLFGGPPRTPEAPITQRECDLARSIQQVTEDIVLGLARTAYALTGEENLCLAGGVALNCVANARLLREGPFRRIWIQPAAGDAGGALGAALAFHHLAQGAPRAPDETHDAMQGALLGPAFSDDEIAAALRAHQLPIEHIDPAMMPALVADHLAAGDVVGFFHGRAEFGPRALGARSILADARHPAMQRQLNLKIKFRESFRPFAPVVLAEHAHEYFDLTAPSPYMLFTAPVRAERRQPLTPDDRRPPLERVHEVRSDLPAVTHVDYSARVQTVDARTHPALHAVLRAFAERTGCAVLVNTSFNVRGEPPVCHPREAIAGFLATEMDCLALGSFWLEKRRLDPARARPQAERVFAPD
jgi:carbamoyltransferase